MTVPALPSMGVDAAGPNAHRRRASARWISMADLRSGATIVVALAAIGLLQGVIWQWWSPPRPQGFVIGPHAVQPDETEAWVAADGRFAVMAVIVGLVAGLVVWMWRATRGPAATVALAIGGLAGSWVCEAVGHLLAGGRTSGKVNTVLHELPLRLHMSGARLLEPAAAVLVYCLVAAFAAEDDLGHPEGDGRPLVEGDVQPQYGWGHGDAPGALHQSNFPAQ